MVLIFLKFLLKFAQSTAVSPHSFPPTAAYSPALLTLKRFVRGTLRQLGIGVVSLMVILSISGHSAAGMLPEGDDFKAESLSLSASTLHLQPREPLSSAASSAAQHLSRSDTETFEPGALSDPFPGLRARMLHHRLTSARLSVPELREPEIASLSAAE